MGGAYGCGDGPDGQAVFEAEPEQPDPPNRLRPGPGRPLPVAGGGLGHDRPGPGPVEQPRLGGLVGRDIRLEAGGRCRPPLEPPGDVADDAVQEGAEVGHPAGPGRRQDTALTEALDEHILSGVVRLGSRRRVAPAGGQVPADRAETAAGQVVAADRAARRRPDGGPAG